MGHAVFGRLFSGRAAVDELPPVDVTSAPQTGPDRTFEYAIEALPCNAMFCDRDLILRFLNRASRNTLAKLQSYLPVPVDTLVGRSLDVLHKPTSKVRTILGASRESSGKHRLPFRRVIEIGPFKFDLRVEPMIDETGEYVGAVVMWDESTQHADDAVKRAQESQRVDIEHLTGNLNVVAAASQQIEFSIAEIAKSAERVARAAEASRESGAQSKVAIESLRQSSNGVGKVTELISSIATQTSVLALNANIEAARAGVHGKGFAVVASEVRKLAEQTASATAEIQAKVAAIGGDVKNAIAAIDHIGAQLDEVSGLSNQVAAATEEQHATAREMAHNIGRAAFRAGEIAKLRVDDNAKS